MYIHVRRSMRVCVVRPSLSLSPTPTHTPPLLLRACVRAYMYACVCAPGYAAGASAGGACALTVFHELVTDYPVVVLKIVGEVAHVDDRVC
eukprot:COSAG05_NODE_7272_length_834_cov_1.175510_1_plen_90_part_01